MSKTEMRALFLSQECPFCWGSRVRRVGHVASGREEGLARRLMECEDCEKWYWAETGEDIPWLFEICTTSIVNPGRCLAEIRAILNSGGIDLPRHRAGEFNRLCSDCLTGRFSHRRSVVRISLGERLPPIKGAARTSR